MELHSHDDVGLENADAVCVCIRLDEDGNAFERRVRTMICMRCERFAEGSDNMDRQMERLDLLLTVSQSSAPCSHRCRESWLRESKCRGDLEACRQQRQPGCVLQTCLPTGLQLYVN